MATNSSLKNDLGQSRLQRILPNNPRLVIAWLAVLVIACLATLPALIQRMIVGLSVTDLTNMVPWGAWVAFYIYFVGLSAGSFVVSTLDYVFGVKRFEKISMTALLASIVSLGMAMVFIGIDIGRWDRALNTIIHFHWTSPLSWAVRFYILFILIIVSLFVAQVRSRRAGQRSEQNRKWQKGLGVAGLFVALLGVLGAEGSLFAVVESRPLWFGGLFPIIIMVSAVVSGVALTSCLYFFSANLKGQVDQVLLRKLGLALAGALSIDLVLTLFEYLIPFIARAHLELEAIKVQVAGPYWWIFWIVQLGLGMVAPIILMASKLRKNVKFVALAAGLTLIGVMALRFNIVVPAQIPPVIAGYPVADYFPSLSEFATSICIIAAGLLAYCLAAIWLSSFIPSNSSKNEEEEQR